MKAVIELHLKDDGTKALKTAYGLKGVDSIFVEKQKNKLTVIVRADPLSVACILGQYARTLVVKMPEENDKSKQPDKDKNRQPDKDKNKQPDKLGAKKGAAGAKKENKQPDKKKNNKKPDIVEARKK